MNYQDPENKGCNFFKWYDDEVVDERDLKIVRQKKKISKLKEEGCLVKEENCLLKQEVCMVKQQLMSSRKCLKISIVCGCLCFGIMMVLMTLLWNGGRANGICTMYLK